MPLSTEIATLSTEAQGEYAKLKTDAVNLWHRGELYMIAGACLFVGLLIGHFAR